MTQQAVLDYDESPTKSLALQPTLYSLVNNFLNQKFEDGVEVSKKMIAEKFPDVDISDLEFSRRWCRMVGLEDRKSEDVLAVYEIIQQNSDIDLGSAAFRYSRSIDAIQNQIQLYRNITGNHLKELQLGKVIDVSSIDDYTIGMHLHECDFGAGLICYSISDKHDNRLSQISFYPSSPMVLYEIKGVASKPNKEKQVKKSVHRFASKYGISTLSGLTIEFLKKAYELNEDVRISSGVQMWRNHGMTGEQKDRANNLHQTVAGDLGINQYGRDDQSSFFYFLNRQNIGLVILKSKPLK